MSFTILYQTKHLDRRNNIGGMLNRRSGGWGSNSRFNGGFNQYGELFCTVCPFVIALMQQNNVTTVLSLSKLEKKIIKIIIVMFKKRSIDEFKYNRRISCTRGTALVLVKCNNLIFIVCQDTNEQL
jgi:hypothetical protein